MFEEVIVAASSTAGDVIVWDSETGASLQNFKNNSCARGCFCRVGREILAAAQRGNRLVRFWAWDKGSSIADAFLSESLTSLVATRDGGYLIGGGQSGTIYVWEIGTGRLLKSWQGHYKAVMALALLDGGNVLISGGDDAIVNAWMLSQILDDSSGQTGRGSQPTAFQSWTDHILPITNVHCGFGGVNAIVVTCSLDCSVKIWQLASGTLLRSIALPSPVFSAITDQGDHTLYAGTRSGTIYEVSLVGGVDDDRRWSLKGHSRGVTCLAVHGDGTRLISGSEDGTARVWDMRTRQCIRSMEFPNKSPITSILNVHQPPLKSLDNSSGSKSKLKIVGLNKTTNALPRGNLKKWDGAPVTAASNVEYSGIARKCGLLVARRPSSQFLNGGDSHAEVNNDNKISTQRLWEANQKLFKFCTEKILDNAWD